MILDNTTLVSDRQAITATAASTDQIDLGPIGSGIRRDVGRGAEVDFLIQVVEAFNNLTSLAVAVQVADDTAFSTNLTTVWTRTLTLAELTVGRIVTPETLLRGTDRRYLRVNYTVTGTAPTTGRITAGITMGNQSNG